MEASSKSGIGFSTLIQHLLEYTELIIFKMKPKPKLKKKPYFSRFFFYRLIVNQEILDCWNTRSVISSNTEDRTSFIFSGNSLIQIITIKTQIRNKLSQKIFISKYETFLPLM